MLLALTACGGPPALETGDTLIEVDASRAQELWRRDLGRAIDVPPLAVESDWVVAPTEGALRRLRGEDGVERWKRKLPASASSTPLLCAGVIVVATDFPSGQVLGIDPATGSVRWKWGRSVGYVAGEDTVLVFAGRGGRILGLDPKDGVVRWEVSRPGSGWRAPVFDAVRRMVFVPVRPDTVLALGEDGTVAWARRAGSWPRIAVGDSSLVMATDDSMLLVWDPVSGDERTRRPLSALAAGPPICAGSTVYLALRNGELLALDASSLSDRWVRRLEPPLLSPPAVTGDLLYQSGTRGRVFVLQAATGAPVDTLLNPEALLCAPSRGRSGIAVGGDEGTLVVFRGIE
jgi:outer membrane protein assembly factor BamB